MAYFSFQEMSLAIQVVILIDYLLLEYLLTMGCGAFITEELFCGTIQSPLYMCSVCKCNRGRKIFRSGLLLLNELEMGYKPVKTN